MAQTKDELKAEIRRELASEGGSATVKKYGKSHMAEIGKKGGAKMKIKAAERKAKKLQEQEKSQG